MKKSGHPGLSIVLVSGALILFGCQQRATSTPVEEPTQSVVVVVVTATPQPTLEPSATPSPNEPSITPLATFTPIGNETITPTVKATAVLTKAATKVATSPKPQPTAAGETPATGKPPAPLFPAPTLIGPGVAQRDSYRDGNSITFSWESVGPLAPNQCYVVYIELVNPNVASNNNRGDEWIAPNSCGDQTPPGKAFKFVFYDGRFQTAPNYGQIAPEAEGLALTDNLIMRWRVQVAETPGGAGVHQNVTFISPQSVTPEFDFKPH